jgi:hypothetical protein
MSKAYDTSPSLSNSYGPESVPSSAPEIVPISEYQDTSKLASHPDRYDPRVKNPFGLSALGYGALISLFTALIIGALFGGALGSLLASCQNKLHRYVQTCILDFNGPYSDINQQRGAAIVSTHQLLLYGTGIQHVESDPTNRPSHKLFSVFRFSNRFIEGGLPQSE